MSELGAERGRDGPSNRSLLRRLSPPQFRDRVDELVRTDAAVTVLPNMLGPDRLLELAHSVGVVRDPQLQACVPPIPPVDLRRITAAPEAELFLYTGLSDVATVVATAARLGPPRQDRRSRILDFGCGCGRLTRFLNCLDNVAAYGVDVNPDLVRWCQTNLSRVQTSLCGATPPLPMPDSTFDLVYALSVFTHLTEQSALAWLDELARVTVPRGTLIVTTQGHPALEVIRSSAGHRQIFEFGVETATEIGARLEAEGFVFVPYRDGVLESARIEADYGNAFIDQGYVAARWDTKHLRLLEHTPGGLRHWQDVVALRRL